MIVRTLLFLVFIISACCSSNTDSIEDESLYIKEIQLRLTELHFFKDSLLCQGISIDSIHQKFSDLLLISKDIENKNAAANLSNLYVADLCEHHQLNAFNLQKITSNMHSSEVSFLLKQNELTILNQILLQKLNRTIPLQTAH